MEKKQKKHALLASEATISAATSIIQHGKKEVQRLKCTCLIKEAKTSLDSGRPQVLSRAVLHSSAFTAQRRRDCNSRTRIHSFLFFPPSALSLSLAASLSSHLDRSTALDSLRPSGAARWERGPNCHHPWTIPGLLIPGSWNSAKYGGGGRACLVGR